MEGEEMEIKDGENEIDEILEIGAADDLLADEEEPVEADDHVEIDPLIVKTPILEDEDEENEEDEEDEEDEEYDLLVESYEDIDNF